MFGLFRKKEKPAVPVVLDLRDEYKPAGNGRLLRDPGWGRQRAHLSGRQPSARLRGCASPRAHDRRAGTHTWSHESYAMG